MLVNEPHPGEDEDRMDLKQTVTNYFLAFEQKDIDTLSDMFHQDVCLKDWNILARGKKSVLAANAEIFKAFDKITVLVENLYLSNMTAIAELSILADDEVPLPVVDVITFHPDLEDGRFKIQSIVAYRGN